MKRAAIYARFSTDLQSEKSVDDQFDLCRAYAAREGLAVVGAFADRARSGASMIERDGLLELLAEVPKGRFDVVLVEAADRLSRDMADLAGIHKRLTYHSIEIRAVHSGVVDTAMVGLFGLVGQMQREEGVKKIRRGLAGVVKDGRSAGGLPYGYRVVNRLDERGEVVRGLRELDEEQAEVVRRVFREYADGRSPREIAAGLNRDRIAPPRGRLWNASTLNGFGKRGSGLLRNQIYVGVIAWNKTRKVRNPDTGRRVPRPNAGEDRHTSDVPHLRIVELDLWETVQARLAERAGLSVTQARRPAHLLTGLLRCGSCGSGLSVHDRDSTGKTRVRCSAVRENGSCTNRRIIYLPGIEAAVVDGMRDQLRDPRLIELYVSRYNETRRKLAATAGRDRAKLETALARAAREHERVLQGYIKGFVSEADAEAQLPALRRERDRLAAEQATADQPPNVIALHPGLITGYLRQVEDLAGQLAEHAQAQPESDASRRLLQSFRALVQSVTVYPFPARQGFEVEVKGRLAELIGPEAFPSGRAIVGDRWCRKRDSNPRPPHYELGSSSFEGNGSPVNLAQLSLSRKGAGSEQARMLINGIEDVPLLSPY